MSEQLRRLDYERRSKFKSLMKSGSGIQNIKKECSTQVRAANEMEDRKTLLYIERNELHKRTFMERHEYETKVIQRFKSDLDVKSQKFSNRKFQELRSKSAGPKLQKAQPVALAIVPKKYYENSEDSDDDGDGTWTKVLRRTDRRWDKEEHKTSKSGGETKLLNFSTLRAVLMFKSLRQQKQEKAKSLKRTTSFSESKQDRISESLRFLHPSEFKERYSEDYQDIPPRFGTSSTTRVKTAPSIMDRTQTASRRRQSTAASVYTAYIPRDVKSAPPRGRTGYTGHVNEQTSDQGTASRSYRILKEAFKKKRKEQPNPSKDKLDKIKTDHGKRVRLLNERIRKRFNDIFEENIFRPMVL